jgi:hypothetical protein
MTMATGQEVQDVRWDLELDAPSSELTTELPFTAEALAADRNSILNEDTVRFLADRGRVTSAIVEADGSGDVDKLLLLREANLRALHSVFGPESGAQFASEAALTLAEDVSLAMKPAREAHGSLVYMHTDGKGPFVAVNEKLNDMGFYLRSLTDTLREASGDAEPLDHHALTVAGMLQSFAREYSVATAYTDRASGNRTRFAGQLGSSAETSNADAQRRRERLSEDTDTAMLYPDEAKYGKLAVNVSARRREVVENRNKGEGAGEPDGGEYTLTHVPKISIVQQAG